MIMNLNIPIHSVDTWPRLTKLLELEAWQEHLQGSEVRKGSF